MIIKDPCKRCIVKACCKSSCERKRDYWNLRLEGVCFTILLTSFMYLMYKLAVKGGIC